MSWSESFSGILLFLYQLALISFDLHYGGSPESIFNSLTQFHRSLTPTGVQTWEMQWMPKAADLLFALVHKNNSLPPPPSPQEKILKIAKKLYMSILSFVWITGCLKALVLRNLGSSEQSCSSSHSGKSFHFWLLLLLYMYAL